MSFDTGVRALESLFNTAKKNKLKTVQILFSGGECLLRFDMLIRLIRYGKQLSKQFNIQIKNVILTNGTLLNNKIVKTLKKEKVHVTVSFDGLGKYHNSTRRYPNGRGSFIDVENAIKLLKKWKVPNNVTIVLTRANIKNIPELFSYLIKKDIHFIINFLRENPNCSPDTHLSNKDLIKWMKKGFNIIRKNPPKESIFSIMMLDRIRFNELRQTVCGAGSYYFTIDTEGNVACCPYSLEKPISTIECVNLMLLIPKKFFTIGVFVDTKTGCKRCKWKYKCGGGCYLLTYEKYKKYNVHSPYCKAYKVLIPEMLKLEADRILTTKY